MSAVSIANHDKIIKLMCSLGLDISGLTPCSNDTRGALSLTVNSTNRMNRETVALNGNFEAIQNLYGQCISHPNVVMFGVV